jgi:hypothetical protein
MCSLLADFRMRLSSMKTNITQSPHSVLREKHCFEAAENEICCHRKLQSLLLLILQIDFYADSFMNESAYCYGRLSVCVCVSVTSVDHVQSFFKLVALGWAHNMLHPSSNQENQTS